MCTDGRGMNIGGMGSVYRRTRDEYRRYGICVQMGEDEYWRYGICVQTG